MSPKNVYVSKILLPIGDFARIERKQNGIHSCNDSNKKNIRANLASTNKKTAEVNIDFPLSFCLKFNCKRKKTQPHNANASAPQKKYRR